MGKLITFWSPFPGLAKVTSSMCAVAGMMGILYPELDVAVSHTKSGSIELEERLDFRIGVEKKKELYEKSGISALALNGMQAVLTSEKIRRCAIPLLLKSLYLFPGSGCMGFENKMIVHLLTEQLRQEFSAVFLDLKSGWQEESLLYMKTADLVVVGMPQLPSYWTAFSEEAEKLSECGNIIFLLGGYMNASKYSLRYFQKEEGKGRIAGAVPINAGFLDAMADGRILDFLLRNQLSKKNEDNYEFIFQTKKTAEYIRKAILLP